jgi:hypothetical protein
MGPLGRAIRRRRRDHVVKRIANLEGLEQSRLQFDHMTHYPSNDVLLMPTQLGNVMNVLNVLSEDLSLRWGIDFTPAWPRMETAISGETALANRINNERARSEIAPRMPSGCVWIRRVVVRNTESGAATRRCPAW